MGYERAKPQPKLEDYDGQRLTFGRLKQIALVQSRSPRKSHLDGYLEWRELQGEIFHSLSPCSSPTLVGIRREISYDGIRKVVEAIGKKLGWTCMPGSATLSPLIWFSKGSLPCHDLTRHKSVQSFRRYTKAADQAAAEAAFYETIRGDHNGSCTQPQSPP